MAQQEALPRQRLAWFFLLASFTTCLLLTISIPVGISWFLQNARDGLDVWVQANQGTVRIDEANGRVGAVGSDDSARLVNPDSTVVANNATAVLFFQLPGSEERLGRVQVYSSTQVHIEEATTPRFSISQEQREAKLDIDDGRIRLVVPEWGERPFAIIVNTPQSEITIKQPGQYAIVVNTLATEVTVDSGEAALSVLLEEGGVRDTLTLVENQGASIPTGFGAIGRYGTDRDLIANGDFANGQDEWTFFTWNVDDSNQPSGQSAIIDVFGEPRLKVIRDGIGHADFRIRQTVEQDVTDLESLELSLTFRVVGQSLSVCGAVGSECPLMVRINYLDSNGTPQVWQHGFFAIGQNSPTTPDACTGCAVIQSVHNKVPLAQDFFYEADIPTELAVQGALPARFIESIELVMSGHSFEVELVNVSLLAKE